MKFPCCTSTLVLCRLIILMYVTIDGFSYSNSDESFFDPMLGWLMDRNDKNDFMMACLSTHKVMVYTIIKFVYNV